MKTILKYMLSVDKCQSQTLPYNAKIIHVDSQGDNMYIWAEVDTQEPMSETRMFSVFGTGHEIPKLTNAEYKHLGTVEMYDGSLIWHVYEVIEIKEN